MEDGRWEMEVGGFNKDDYLVSAEVSKI